MPDAEEPVRDGAELSSLVTVVQLGGVTGLHAGRRAVRMAGLDIGVHRSDRHAPLGKLTRQGSAPLCLALYEPRRPRAGPRGPDYHALKNRGLSHNRSSLTIARKLARRSVHLCGRSAPPRSTHQTPLPHSTAPDQARPTDASHTCGQLQQRSRHPHPAWRPTKRERPQSLHRNDRSTISSPTANSGGRGPR